MKKLLSFCITLCVCVNISAQRTDLVVDNQTPGWLSSKINYGDQKTVRNLKVTGYINATDLKFIGTLIKGRHLDGTLDLGDVEIAPIEVSPFHENKENHMYDNPMDIQYNDTLKCFIFPRSLVYGSNCLGKLFVDSIVFDTKMNYINKEVIYSRDDSNRPVKFRKIWIGNSVDSIPRCAFYAGNSDVFADTCLQSLRLPETIRYIGEGAFYNCMKLSSVNTEVFSKLHHIGAWAFNKTKVYLNSYHVPKEMKTFYLSAFMFNDGAHILISKSTTSVSIEPQHTSGYMSNHPIVRGSAIYHIESETPPSFELAAPRLVIIPKGSMSAYKKEYYWKDLNLKEQNPIEQIKLQFKKLNLEKEETKRLSFTCTPHDAEDTRVTWSSSNNKVVKVSNAGDVTAIKPGKAFVYAVSVVDSKVKDSCEIVVLQHIQSFTIEPATVLLTKLGDRIKLQTKIQPGDATDKTIRWNSSNQSVCTVTNDGTVIATGNGSTVVLAYTNDGNIPATCVVTVNTEITGIDNVETTPAVQKSSNGITLRTVLGKYIRIYNSQGTIIYKQRADKDVFELPMSKGMYLIQIDNNVVKIVL